MKWRLLALLLCLVPVLSGCGREQGRAENMEQLIGSRCEELVGLYRQCYASVEQTEPESLWERASLAQEDIDALEAILLEAGLPVLDSDEPTPD